MKKETTTKSKLWIWIVAAAVLLLAVGGAALAFLLPGGNQGNAPATTDPIPTGPRADLYWNLDREFYTANSQTGLSTREADADGKFRMKFAFNGEIVELEIIDKKLVNIIDTQDIVGLQFDENGVVIGQINVRELVTEVGKKVYIKKATDDMIIANSSMAMNGMELNLKLGQYSEIYDLREGSATYGQKIAPSDLGVMDCMTVYANAEGDNTHFYILAAATRSKIYWRANLWVSDSVNHGGMNADENGVYTLPFYCEGEFVEVKTKDAELVEYYGDMGKHSGFTGLIFDDEGYAIDIINAAVGAAGQQTFFALDIEEINGNHVKLKAYWSTSGVQAWEGDIPAETPIYNVSSWAYSEGVMGQKLTVADLKVGDRLTMFSDMDGNPIEIGLTLRTVDLKPMFNNNSKYDAATRSTTRVKGEDGYWEYTFINEKGISKYKTKDQKLANFIDSYPERVFGIVTKGDKLVKAYEYDCIYAQVRFSTALYVDSINGTIISCTDQKKANAYTAVLSEDYKVLDISGDSKQWGQKINLQVGDCMISFRNRNKEVCMIYVTKRSQGGKLYVNTTPNTSRAPIQVDKDGNALEEKDWYWQYEMTDINGKQVTLQLPVGKKDANGVYANKHLQSRIDSASQGIIALEVSGTKIKDAHAVANMASGNSVGSVFITKAGTTEFEYKTTAKPNDETSIYPGWTGSEGVKYINLSGDYKSHKGEKLSGGMKVNDVYYMVRNRANETVAMFLISRGFHNDLFFLKENYPVVNGVTTRPVDADGYYVFSVMYAGKPATVRTKDAAMATQLEGYRTGAALKLDKANKNTVLAANDFKGTNDAYASVVNNWDVSKIKGNDITLTLNIPTTTTTVGDTKEINIKGAKIYNISPDAGEEFGKITKLQKNDRVRIYTDKNGKVSYVLVTVRAGLKTAECAHCGKTVTWNPITASSGMGTGSAHYYVFADMKTTGQMSVSAANETEYDVVIDLNGKTIYNVANTARTFMVAYPGKSLTLLDSVGTGHVKSHGWFGNAGLIQVSYGASLTIMGGTYELLGLEEGMKATQQGGVIFSWNDNNYPNHRNTVNIKGGTIIGNEIAHKNRATDPGMASVYAYGGTLYAQMSDIYMSGGTITGGIADRGGNIYLGSTATFTMTGGEVTNGTAKNRGGNFFAATGAKITIDGGKVLNGNVLENLVEWEVEGVPTSKKTGQQGGNFVGHDITILSGEVSGGHANTTGGNFFLLGTGNKLSIYGGVIGNATANSGGANVYVYGGEGLVEVYGGEIDASGITMGSDGSKGSVLAVYGGKVGAASIAKDCGAVIGGSAKIDKLSLNKDAKDMGIMELTAEAKIYIDASDKFAKAYEGFETLDIAAYIGNQIVPFNAETTTITCETTDNVKYLVATVASTPTPDPEPDPEPDPDAPAFEAVIEAANKMTTDGVFASGETVTAVCPVCGGEAVEWVPLTASMQHLNEFTQTHFYLPGNVERTANSQRYYVEEGTVCIHLNGFTYDQKATSACEGAIKISAGSTLNIMGNGTVIGAGGYYADSSWPMGGALDVRGTANIYGGTYMSDRNRPSVAPFASSGATINMYGGTIAPSSSAESNPTGFWGSIVMNHAAQSFNLYGGEIVGAEGATAGDLRVNNGTFNVYGGYVGRVYANKNAKVNVNNGANIGELDIKAGATVTLADDLAEGTEVYITDGAGEGAGLTVANAKAAEYANKYILAADETKVLMANAENQLYVVAKQTLVDNLNTTLATATTNVEAVCPVCVKNATWVPLTATMGKLDDGVNTHYYMAENITREDSGRFTVDTEGSTICIHLNGKTYTQANTGNIEGAIKTGKDTVVNLMDVADNSGTVIGVGKAYDLGSNGSSNWQATGGAIDARGVVNIYGGTYKSNHHQRPAVSLWNANGTINMYGGKIVKGDITVDQHSLSNNVRIRVSGATFNMYGGEISGGLASQGGNVYMLGGTFNMYGGTIKDGTAGNLGGNVRLAGGTFNMEGGEILNATTTGATATGGSIGLSGSAVLNVSGGVIDGGTAAQGGLIGNNGATVNISGTAVLKNGVAKNNGGNITAMSGTMNITGGTISGGKIGTEPELKDNDLFVYAGKTVTLGKDASVANIIVSGTLAVENGTVATVTLNAGGKIALPANVATGTEITVIAAATQTIATIDNAADYLAYFKTNVAGATIGVKADTTNEIEIVVPVAE